ARLGLLPGPLDVVEDPLDLGTGEVGGQGQAADRLVLVRTLVATELGDDLGGAGVLPDDGVVHRLAGVLVPHHRGLALVGDAHRGDVLVGEVAAGQRQADDLTGVGPDLLRVVLDPSRLGEDLLVLLLPDGVDLAGLGEHDRPGAGGALVDREYVVSHLLASPR